MRIIQKNLNNTPTKLSQDTNNELSGVKTLRPQQLPVQPPLLPNSGMIGIKKEALSFFFLWLKFIDRMFYGQNALIDFKTPKLTGNNLKNNKARYSVNSLSSILRRIFCPALKVTTRRAVT